MKMKMFGNGGGLVRGGGSSSSFFLLLSASTSSSSAATNQPCQMPLVLRIPTYHSPSPFPVVPTTTPTRRRRDGSHPLSLSSPFVVSHHFFCSSSDPSSGGIGILPVVWGGGGGGLGLKKCFCATSTTSTTSSSSPAQEQPGDEEAVAAAAIKEAANTLDIRVGKILKAWRHPEADSLYVEEVDVGEPQPRTICSGLVNFIPLQRLQDRKVVVLANLKPRNMRGIKSSGMLMAASDASHEHVELLDPPEASLPGERIWFGSVDDKHNLPDVVSPNQIQKKKIWELVQPHLKTDDSCVAALGMHTMRTIGGVVVSRSLKNARIS